MMTDLQLQQLEAMLDSALEHCSHVWNAMVRNELVSQYTGDAWPPIVQSSPGELVYHFVAVIEYVKKAYEFVPHDD